MNLDQIICSCILFISLILIGVFSFNAGRWKEVYDNKNKINKLKDDNIWQCGCGHKNWCNLAFCANCGRKPYET